MSKISIIVPCYNEQEVLPFLYKELNKLGLELPQHDFEFLLVDDGSKDQTLDKIRALAQKDTRLRYISFSRNFGKESAIYAGLKNASGDLCVLMDADLQHSPALLPTMIAAVEKEGYDSCATRRVTRIGEPPIRSFFARKFYKIMNKISDIDLVDGAQDYRIMNRPFVEAVLRLSEYNRFSKGIFNWVGYKTKWLECENVERTVGETKWSFWKLLKYALGGITSFTTFPLHFSSILGSLFLGISFLSAIIIFIRNTFFGASLSYQNTIDFLTGGSQLLSIGILGQYLAQTYLEVKNRPIYLCQESNIESFNSHQR